MRVGLFKVQTHEVLLISNLVVICARCIGDSQLVKLRIVRVFLSVKGAVEVCNAVLRVYDSLHKGERNRKDFSRAGDFNLHCKRKEIYNLYFCGVKICFTPL